MRQNRDGRRGKCGSKHFLMNILESSILCGSRMKRGSTCQGTWTHRIPGCGLLRIRMCTMRNHCTHWRLEFDVRFPDGRSSGPFSLNRQWTHEYIWISWMMRSCNIVSSSKMVWHVQWHHCRNWVQFWGQYHLQGTVATMITWLKPARLLPMGHSQRSCVWK
jgi:hypothetical protein